MENNRDDNFVAALLDMIEKKFDDKLEPIHDSLISAIADAEEIKSIMRETDVKKTDTKESKKNQDITVNIKETKENIKDVYSDINDTLERIDNNTEICEICDRIIAIAKKMNEEMEQSENYERNFWLEPPNTHYLN